MADPLCVDINEILQSSPEISSDVCIFKVHNALREVNKNAYEPQIISIGPYHYGKDHLKFMEAYKVHSLQMLLKERKECDVKRYVEKMRDLEKRARNCYAEPVILDENDFIKMMLLDGCFTLDMILRRHAYNFLIKQPALLCSICFDMLLVENQLPFFVIWELFGLIEHQDEQDFMDTILAFLNHVCPYDKQLPSRDWMPVNEIKHILHFTHHRFVADPDLSEDPNGNWKFIPCATTLQDAGMKFEVHQANSLFRISFEPQTGVVKIPKVKVGDDMEGLLRNFVAFEQLYPHQYLHTVADYIILMDSLIDSAKDVEILCQNGIIVNMLGDNEAAANMFNRLGKHVIFLSGNFYYAQLFNQMNGYCDRNKRWNKLIAHIKRNYFNSPWAPLVSVLAASLLLLLTVLQTVFTILSYTK